jgi:hypothetical protein
MRLPRVVFAGHGAEVGFELMRVVEAPDVVDGGEEGGGGDGADAGDRAQARHAGILDGELILVMAGRGSDSCRGNLNHQGVHPARPASQDVTSRIDAAPGLDRRPPAAAFASFRHYQLGGRTVHLDGCVGLPTKSVSDMVLARCC